MSGRPAARRRLAVLVSILLFVMVAPWLAPRSPELQEDAAGARYLPPLTRAHALRIDAFHLRIVTHLRETPDNWEFERAGKTGSIPAAALLGTPETRFYLLGTDGLGRDLLSRVLTGARHSLGIAALSVALAMVLGAAAGAAAGLLGGLWDTLIMRGVDVVMSIPRVLVYLVCAALFPPSSLLLVMVLGATTWTGLARIVRAEMMSIRGGDLALGARAVGSRPLRVVLLHLLPQMGPVLATTASLRFADTLLLESALSLLGLGPPAVSLGAIMGSGRDVLADAWWVVVWPGVVISASVGTLRAAAAGLFRLADPPSLS